MGTTQKYDDYEQHHSFLIWLMEVDCDA